VFDLLLAWVVDLLLAWVADLLLARVVGLLVLVWVAILVFDLLPAGGLEPDARALADNRLKLVSSNLGRSIPPNTCT